MCQLGKLKKTLKERCPECGAHLQLRTRGEMVGGGGRGYSDDYTYCPTCDEETPLPRQKRRSKELVEIEV